MQSNFIFYHLKPLSLIALAGALGGCGSLSKDVEKIAAQNQAQVLAAEEKASKPVPVVIRNQGAWLLGQSVQVYTPPSPQLARKIAWRPDTRVTLADVGAYVSKQTGLTVDTSEVWSHTSSASTQASLPVPVTPQTQIVPGLTPAAPGQAIPSTQNSPFLFELAYEGTVSGLMDFVANKTGVWWRYSDGGVTFFREETKTFIIPALNNSTNGGSSITSGVSNAASSGSTSTSSGSGTTTNGGTTSNSSYTVDIWKDLEKTAQTVGGSARVVTNPTLGSITVTGSPTQVRRVEEWTKTLTESLSQQVQISVTVYRVDISREDNYSWNPTVIFNSLSGNYGFSLSPPQSPSTTSGNTPMSFTSSVLQTATGNAARFTGSQLAFKALSSLGNTSVLYTRTLVSLNRHAAPLQVADVEGYLASRTRSGTTTDGTVLPTTITPGSITTGFTANFIPVVANGKVLLSADMTISSNKGFVTLGDTDSFIQAVNIGLATFSTTSSLTPGDAILLTGYTQQAGSSSNSGVGSPNFNLMGGGVNHSMNKQMLAIVVEAKVL